MADANDGVLPAAAQPQVPAIHQEFNAVLLRSDRIRIVFRDTLKRPRPTLISSSYPPWARCSSRIRPVSDQRALLREMLQRLEDLFGKFALYTDALHNPGPVAQLRKNDLARFAQIVKPARELAPLHPRAYRRRQFEFVEQYSSNRLR